MEEEEEEEEEDAQEEEEEEEAVVAEPVAEEEEEEEEALFDAGGSRSLTHSGTRTQPTLTHTHSVTLTHPHSLTQSHSRTLHVPPLYTHAFTPPSPPPTHTCYEYIRLCMQAHPLPLHASTRSPAPKALNPDPLQGP